MHFHNLKKDKTKSLNLILKVQGYQIKRKPYRSPFFVGSTNYQLYRSGKLLYFQPTEDVKIDGVWCRPSPAEGVVHLFENGELKECTLAKDQVIQEKKIEKNFTLKFDKNGKLYYVKKKSFFGEY